MSKLFQKLAQIQSELKSVPESGRNTFHNYKYATAEDIINAARPVCSRHGIFITVSCSEHQILKDGRAASVIVTLTAVDSESGESISCTMPGYAEDAKSDKSLWKAMTGATKYAIRSFFCLASSDDPEVDDAQERAPSETSAPDTSNGKPAKPVATNTAAPSPRPQQTQQPPPPAPAAAAPAANGDTTTASRPQSRNGESPNDAPATNQDAFAGLIEATTLEMCRIGWSNAQGRRFLEENFGLPTRRLLTARQLQQFLEHLRKLPSAREPVPS